MARWEQADFMVRKSLKDDTEIDGDVEILVDDKAKQTLGLIVITDVAAYPYASDAKTFEIVNGGIFADVAAAKSWCETKAGVTVEKTEGN